MKFHATMQTLEAIKMVGFNDSPGSIIAISICFKPHKRPTEIIMVPGFVSKTYVNGDGGD